MGEGVKDPAVARVNYLLAGAARRAEAARPLPLYSQPPHLPWQGLLGATRPRLS